MIAHGRNKIALARSGVCNACGASLTFGGLIEASEASEASVASVASEPCDTSEAPTLCITHLFKFLLTHGGKSNS